MKREIYLGRVNMGSVQSNAGIFYGETALRGWQTRSKSNGAVSRISGDGNVIISRLNLLNDPDFIDMIVKTPKV